MNPFQKNPFINTTVAKPIKPVKQFNEKEKINNIKENMAKLKNQPFKFEEKKTQTEISVNYKVNLLKNIDRYK